MAETPPRHGRFAREVNRRVARAITAHNKALFPNPRGPRILPPRPSWDTKGSGYSMYHEPEFYTDEELAVIASQRPYWPNEPAATAWSRYNQDLTLQLRYRDHRRYPPLSRPYNAEELHLTAQVAQEVAARSSPPAPPVPEGPPRSTAPRGSASGAA